VQAQFLQVGVGGRLFGHREAVRVRSRPGHRDDEAPDDEKSKEFWAHRFVSFRLERKKVTKFESFLNQFLRRIFEFLSFGSWFVIKTSGAGVPLYIGRFDAASRFIVARAAQRSARSFPGLVPSETKLKKKKKNHPTSRLQKGCLYFVVELIISSF